MYVTGCDLEKSFIFEKAFEITSTYADRFMCKHIVDNLIFQGMGVSTVRKVSNSRSNLQGIQGHGNVAILKATFDLLLVFHCSCLYLAPFITSCYQDLKMTLNTSSLGVVYHACTGTS